MAREVPQPGFFQTAPAGGAYRLAHASGQVERDRDFGDTYTGSITGVVFHDQNADGIQSAAEPLLGGWDVYADLNGNAQLDANEPSAVSSSTFYYVLTGVPLDTPLSVRVVPSRSTGAPWEISAAPGPVTLTAQHPYASRQDVGAFRRGSISGVKFEDVDGDGTRDAGEPILPGWTIYLDENHDGQFDAGSPRTIAASDVPRTIPPAIPAGRVVLPGIATSTLSGAGLAGTITDIDVTLSASFAGTGSLSALLISPAGTQIQLFDRVGGAGTNFSNTTFDDQATSSITAAHANSRVCWSAARYWPILLRTCGNACASRASRRALRLSRTSSHCG